MFKRVQQSVVIIFDYSRTRLVLTQKPYMPQSSLSWTASQIQEREPGSEVVN
jgi:hypothetical protein